MKIGVMQINNTLDIQGNIKKIIELIESYEDVSYFVLPENALTGYTSEVSELKTLTLDDERLLTLRDYCSSRGKHVFAGAALVLEDGCYNSYLHIHDDIQIYNKTHLGKKEQQVFKAGNQLNLLQTDDISFGTCICVESHIPDIAQTYAIRGAECLLMPFASPNQCGSRDVLWNKYLPARAYDNGLYVIAVNLTGTLNGLTFSGGIMVIDPKGKVVVSHFNEDETVQVFDFDKQRVEARQIGKTNYLERRRQELYEGSNHVIY